MDLENIPSIPGYISNQETETPDYKISLGIQNVNDFEIF